MQKSTENGDADVMSTLFNYRENPFENETWNISSSVTQFEYYFIKNGEKKEIEINNLIEPLEIQIPMLVIYLTMNIININN